MPALNYKPEIAERYENGSKLHTIRTRRRDGRNPRPGQTLYQYTGQRTKKCRKLGEDTCKHVRDIQIWFPEASGLPTIEIDGQRLSVCQFDQFARNDGFDDMVAMCNWFRESYTKNATHEYILWPFEGLLIQWRETDY